MNILIVGSGGREHALGWKLKQSPHTTKLFFAPGNGGTGELGININIKAHEINKLLSFAIENNIDVTIVGPEDPLSMGIVDLFESKNQMIFGPSRLASRLESSKAWSTWFMKKYGIPQPISYTFKDYKKACSFFTTHNPLQFVIKASGLALGKGVILPQTKKEALGTIKKIMVDKEFGEAGNEVVIQEKLAGEEVSIIAISDGTTITPLLPAQDHKRIFDKDKGPNTGGMGAYAPVPFVTKKIINKIHETILQPTVEGMKKEGCPYKGVLYAGLMITKDGPKVLEYNVRFGDPETQPIMMLLKSDLLPLMLSCIKGNLKNKKIIFHNQASACVVLASKGYPGSYKKGELIQGLKTSDDKDIVIFHAGTTEKEGALFTNGGRVLGITARGKNFKDTIKKAYSIIGRKGVYFKGMQYRKDIGKKVIKNISAR